MQVPPAKREIRARGSLLRQRVRFQGSGSFRGNHALSELRLFPGQTPAASALKSILEGDAPEFAALAVSRSACRIHIWTQRRSVQTMSDQSVSEHRSERIGGQQALKIAVDRLGRRRFQASLVGWAERLELEHEQAAQRVEAAFLDTVLAAFLDAFLDAFFAAFLEAFLVELFGDGHGNFLGAGA